LLSLSAATRRLRPATTECRAGKGLWAAATAAPKGADMIPRLSFQNFISPKILIIPGAFGSEITRIPQMDEVLRRHRHLLGLQVRNDRRARSSSAARLKRDRTPERCSRGLRRAPLPGAYAYRYRPRPDEVCVWDRQSFRFL